MDKKQAIKLGQLLRTTRKDLGLFSTEVALRSGMADSNVIRLEHGKIANPRPETLKALADVLGLDLSDLYATAGYVQPDGLPSFTPYLRSKYADMPASAKRELEASFKKIAAKHGYDPVGPQPGEDEN